MSSKVDFRIWDKKNKEMIEDVHICPEYGWIVMSDNDALEERGRVDPKTLIWMQYTGLHDKYGTYIYEGDILREYSNEIEDWIVSYSYGKFVGTLDNVDVDLYDLSDLEVIGNIYERDGKE